MSTTVLRKRFNQLSPLERRKLLEYLAKNGPGVDQAPSPSRWIKRKEPRNPRISADKKGEGEGVF